LPVPFLAGFLGDLGFFIVIFSSSFSLPEKALAYVKCVYFYARCSRSSRVASSSR
jgi:hypothetical protein